MKYAGARPIEYDGTPGDAVRRCRRAAEVYRSLAHPTLVRLRESIAIGAGYALVFDWTDAIPLGRQYEQSGRIRALTPTQRADAVQQIYDFHVHAVRRGWVAVDLYDGSVLVEPSTGTVTLCDLDLYERAPAVNRMGRMWGSTRFMSPEELELGASIDQVSTVFALGAIAHTFLGEDRTKARRAWLGTDEQYAVASTALQPERALRWQSVLDLAAAWSSTRA